MPPPQLPPQPACAAWLADWPEARPPAPALMVSGLPSGICTFLPPTETVAELAPDPSAALETPADSGALGGKRLAKGFAVGGVDERAGPGEGAGGGAGGAAGAAAGRVPVRKLTDTLALSSNPGS